MAKPIHWLDRQIGHRVRNTRQLRGYNIPLIAELLSISSFDLKQKETGLRRFTLDEILALARLLEVTPVFFFKYASPNDDFFLDLKHRANVFSFFDFSEAKTAAKRTATPMKTL
jgi:transcriptional regulator with XRE-family HTH domain